jgi:nitrite reductase/ring-hydroxylating ferredoxin subunit
MGNRELVEGREDRAIVAARLRGLRQDPVEGISRRTLLRRSLGLGFALWLTEVGAGSISFLWNAVGGAAKGVRIGTLAEIAALNPAIPFLSGFPMYIQAARSFVVLVDPTKGFLSGVDPKGEGLLNVRALSQVCPHLGCRPNPCIEDYWFHCPCHQSRYDRLGIKPTGDGFFGPADRGMDRFAVSVDADGVLTIDTSNITLGPLPVELGTPGVIPPLVPHERACS